jgi:predicted DNA-binding WGR domain protein
MRIYMQITPGHDKPPGFCHLILQPDLLGGWSLIREWGKQGAAGRIRREHHESWDAALAAMMRVRDERLRGGYRVVFVQGDSRPS